MRRPRTCATASIRCSASTRSPRESGLNETYLSYQRYRWNPTAENYDIVGENFSGLLRIGGRDTNQRMVQERLSLRNDYTTFLRGAATTRPKPARSSAGRTTTSGRS